MWWIPGLNLFLISLGAYWNVAAAAPRRTNPEENEGLFQGDMLYSPSRRGRAGLRDQRYRWPDATVYYAFQSNYPEHLRERFISATEYIAERTCIRFQDHRISPSPTEDFIFVVQKGGCYSEVGRAGNLQLISLPEECEFGNMVHELLHTIGFHHEQSRPDRDYYVEILLDNVQVGLQNNFYAFPVQQVDTFGVPYDYESIMHYHAMAFSKDGKSPTIMPLDTSISPSVMGQRDHMTEKDALKVNRMYYC